MTTRRQTLKFLGAAGAAAFGLPAYAETGLFADRVAKGELPEMADRLPTNPRVVDLASMGREPGRPGGTIRMIIGKARDVRYMPVNGYSRLIGYDQSFSFQADILESFDVEQDRIFTLHLRPGHRWSDGSAFTTEDFRFFWEDVLGYSEWYADGIPHDYRIAGKPPKVTVLDPLTVRFEWADPNPEFLPNLARPVPLRVFVPSAYLKPFHPKFGDAEKIKAALETYKVDDAMALYQKLSRSNRPENPDLPTLEPWIPRTAPPAEQFIFERNPYFHRVDEKGQQLPYIDRFELNVSSGDIISAKAATGEADMQMNGLDFDDYTLLKDAEGRHPIKVGLWKRVQGSRAALYPNLNCSDPVWQKVMRDVRVRRAMSMAMNRTEINAALFYGLGAESANTVLPDSPLYRPEYATAYTTHDVDGANALLDEAGLDKRDANGIRLLPDGRPANIIIESSGESTLETDILELVRSQFRDVGLAVFPRSSERDLFRSRALGGEIVMSIFNGLDNGVATADMPPAELAPTLDDQLQWPLWGVYFLSGGAQGEAPDMPEVAELVKLFHQWRVSESTPERTRIWTRMLEIHSEQIFSIGTVNSTMQPVVMASWLRNVPEEGLYGYDPTSYMGVYMPDTFWSDKAP